MRVRLTPGAACSGETHCSVFCPSKLPVKILSWSFHVFLTKEAEPTPAGGVAEVFLIIPYSYFNATRHGPKDSVPSDNSDLALCLHPIIQTHRPTDPHLPGEAERRGAEAPRLEAGAREGQRHHGAEPGDPDRGLRGPHVLPGQ